MNNSQTTAECCSAIHAAWASRDPSRGYWTLPGHILALIIDDMVSELPESTMLQMAKLNNFESVNELVRSLKTLQSSELHVA